MRIPRNAAVVLGGAIVAIIGAAVPASAQLRDPMPAHDALRLVAATTDQTVRSGKGDAAAKDGGPTGRVPAADSPEINTLQEMFAAVRACYIPPPVGKASAAMEFTVRFAFKRNGEIIAPPLVTYSSHDVPPVIRDAYRDAVSAALARCSPFHFSTSMGDAIAGEPLSMRFMENRNIRTDKTTY
jgi:hypothetical protein